MEKYDLIIVGAGPGGYVSAIRAAQLGFKTAIVENREVGGTCLNRGCVPTKALIHVSQLYNSFKGAERFGVSADKIGIDLLKAYEYKDSTVSRLRSGIEALLKGNRVTLLRGTAVIDGSGHVIIKNAGDTVLKADKVLVATGSKLVIPKIPGINLDGVITSDGLLSDPSNCKKSVIIIGGGVISCEFALVLAATGSKVTILEAMPRILPSFDRDISQGLKMSMKKRGIEIYTGASVEKIESSAEGLSCVFSLKEKSQTATAEKVLAAVGRAANTESLFADGTAVKMERGRILVDGNFETSVPGIYAIGDVIAGTQLAHAASAQGRYAVEKMAGKIPSLDLAVVPSCLYTDPEIASVGITEERAKEIGLEVKIGKYITTSNAKSVIEDLERGFVKVIFDKKSGALVGAHIMCARATDMIGEMATAIANNMTSEQLLKAMKAHPTFSESITEAIENCEGCSIHTLPSPFQLKQSADNLI